MRLLGKSAIIVLAGLAFAACGYDWTVVPQKDTDGIGSAPDNTSSGKVPRCTSDAECGSGSYCAFPDHRCGTGIKEGECDFLAVTQKCSAATPETVCGCNGQLFKSRCLAQVVGDVGQSCTSTSPDLFPCGYLFCNSGTQFCSQATKGSVSQFKCVDFTCAKPGCACPEIQCSCEAQGSNVTEHCN